LLQQLLLLLLLLLLLIWLLLLLLLFLLPQLLSPGLQHRWVSRRPHDVAASQHAPPGQTMLLPRHGTKATFRRFSHQQA
jgi:hypothetical protein